MAGQGYLKAHGRHLETDECQEAVEESGPELRAHTAHGHSDPGSPGCRTRLVEDEASVLDSGDQEEDVHYCRREATTRTTTLLRPMGMQAANRPYGPRKRRDGDPEDQEEDALPTRSWPRSR